MRRVYRNDDPPEQDEGCEVCLNHIDHCVCPECPVCGEPGNPKCYEDGHLKIDPKKILNLKQLIEQVGLGSTPADLGRYAYKFTDCGPWIVFVLKNADDIHYESKEAKDMTTWWSDCSGIKIGSIVEGSDVEVGPIELKFPFSEDEFWQSLDAIDEMVDEIWHEEDENVPSDND